MNESTGDRRRAILHAAGIAICLTVLSACANPFETSFDELGMIATREQLRRIEPLKLDQFEKTAEQKAGEVQTSSTEEDPLGLREREQMDLTLEQCRAWTLEYNLDLQVALVDPLIANEQISIEEAQFEAILFNRTTYTSLNQPTDTTLEGSEVNFANSTTGVQIPLRSGGRVDVTLPLDRTDTDNAFSTLNPSYESDLRFSVSQPLLRNAGRRVNTHGVRLAALDSQIVQAQTKLSIIREVALVDRAYWRLFAAKKLLEVTQEQYELADDQLRRAQSRFEAGEVPELEVIRARSGLADRLEGIIVAENAVQREQRELLRIINVPGLPMNSRIIMDLKSDPDPVRYELDPEAVVDASLEGRMELLELSLQLAKDRSNIDFARNQLLPQLDLTGSYVLNGLGDGFTRSVEVMSKGQFEDWSVGLNFEVPIGNEAAEGRYNQAVLTRLQRLTTKESREALIRQEVYDSIDELEASWQRILAARQSVVLAARTYEGEQRQFDVGERTSTDVLDAATRLADAQASEIRAITDYQISQINLAFATGTLLGASRIDWEPYDPRTPDDRVGEQFVRERVWERAGP